MSYLSIFNYYCNFCSKLRRVLLIYDKKLLDQVLNDNLLGVSLMNNDKLMNNKEEEEEINENNKKNQEEIKNNKKKEINEIMQETQQKILKDMAYHPNPKNMKNLSNL